MNCRECIYFWSCPERSIEEDNICNDFYYDEELGEKGDIPCWNCKEESD